VRVAEGQNMVTSGTERLGGLRKAFSEEEGRDGRGDCLEPPQGLLIGCCEGSVGGLRGEKGELKPGGVWRTAAVEGGRMFQNIDEKIRD